MRAPEPLVLKSMLSEGTEMCQGSFGVLTYCTVRRVEVGVHQREDEDDCFEHGKLHVTSYVGSLICVCLDETGFGRKGRAKSTTTTHDEVS